MAGRLEGKRALVSGAGSRGDGMSNGRAAAIVFAREGAHIIALDRDEASAAETCKLIEEEGGSCEVVVADVARVEEVERAVAGCTEGDAPIDILYNNVGIGGVFGGPVEVAEEDWDRQMEVNVKSIFLMCKSVLPRMGARGSGAIVNVSSVVSTRSTVNPTVSYASSKAAVNQLTKAIAIQYAPMGIRCNAVLPGFIDTPLSRVSLARHGFGGDVEAMIRNRSALAPMGRMGTPWDIAYAGLFLASDEAAYVTGVLLPVDGGFLA